MNPDRAARKGKGRLGRLIGFWLPAWLALASAPAAWGAIRYVKTGATGANNGTSWANAYKDLQSALGAAKSGDEIWVVAETYKPTTGTDRTASFVMRSNVTIYGGFAGTETASNQRNWPAYVTILSGDIGTIGDATDNSYHVVTGVSLGVLDGFTITGGNANGSSSYSNGGGMINSSVSPTIANCTFTSNGASYGGGMYNNANASPTVTNCTFTYNTASGDYGCGGGMYNTGSKPTVTNCTFANNAASGGYDNGYYGYGGGMDNESSSSPTVTDCTFTSNGASYGGGMDNWSSSPTVASCAFTSNGASYGGGMSNISSSSPIVTNCTLANNAAYGGGGLYNDSNSLSTVTNCIFWINSATTGAQVYKASGTLTYKHCDIQASGGSTAWVTSLGTDGGGNIDVDPLFVNASNPAGLDGIWRTSDDGLCLLGGSPCINAGTATGAPTTDILGNPRVGLPDIGAYEYQPPTPPGTPTVTSAAAYTNDTTPTWTWVSGGGGNGTFRYQLDSTGGSWTMTTGTSYTPATALADGAHALYVEEESSAGVWSAWGSYTVTVDTVPPNAPTVASAASLTNNAKPTWTWTEGGGGGNGTFRYQIDSTTGTWTTTTATSYTPATALADGSHTLNVEERDAAGNWSAWGSYTVTVDATPPGTPVVTSAAAYTNDTTPTWTWTTGGGGNGTFRYQLDSTSGAWTTTTGTSYTPATALANGTHTLDVEERDAAGNWSAAGNYAVTVDTVAPGEPTVTSGASPTNNVKPTWTWTSGGGGNGTFQYQLDSTSGAWTTTTSTSFTPTTALADGTHVLYVEERDDAGNWSEAGSFAVTINTAPGAPVVISAAAITNDTTPTWTWTSGGGGNGTFQYQLDSTGGSWTTTTGTSYTPATALTDGKHVLDVEERNDAGVWSAAGSYSVTVDTTPPGAPTVTATRATPLRPTWAWTSGGGGNGTFQFQLDSTGGAWTTTTATRFTAFEDLSLGAHALYVRERDDAGNWSAIGSCSIAAIDAAQGWRGYR